jgi:hypothetical protein
MHFTDYPYCYGFLDEPEILLDKEIEITMALG